MTAMAKMQAQKLSEDSPSPLCRNFIVFPAVKPHPSRKAYLGARQWSAGYFSRKPAACRRGSRMQVRSGAARDAGLPVVGAGLQARFPFVGAYFAGIVARLAGLLALRVGILRLRRLCRNHQDKC